MPKEHVRSSTIKFVEKVDTKGRFWVAVWMLPFLCFLIGYLFTGYFLRTSDLVAPNVIGKSLQEGVVLLSENHLGLRLLHRQEDATLPEGTILDQLPRPQQKIRHNQNVFVSVSVRQRPGIMGDFWGKREQESVALLAKSGLEPQVVHVASAYPCNVCIGQYPCVGQELINKQVTMYISSGPSVVAIMPKLRGVLLKDIQKLMNQNDVRAEVFHASAQPPDHSCEQCVVIDQQPEVGAIINLAKSLLMQLKVAQGDI